MVTADETAELIERLYADGRLSLDAKNAAAIAAMLRQADAIEALAARLTAAEADADRLSVDVKSLISRLDAHLEHPEVGIDGVTQMVLDDSGYDLRLHDEVLALRNPS